MLLHPCTRWAAAAVSCVILAGPGAAQLGSTLRTYSSQAAEDNFGTSVDVAGDVDADGILDYVVGAYLNDTAGADAGQVRVFSGGDGTVLHVFDGDQAGDQLGFSVAGAGDVNGDGRADIVAGADLGNYARVYSGADGSVLYTFFGDAANDLFGTAVSGVGDVDLDGRADVLVGAPGADLGSGNEGLVRLHSGLDGSVLRTWFGRIAGTGLGRAVACAGFIDADNVPDVIFGANNGSNVALVYPGDGGRVLHAFFGDSGLDWFGTSVAGAGDVDGDGVDDLVVGAPQSFLGPGYVRVFSGANGALIREHNGAAPIDLFGWSVSGAGDVDGDGRADYVVGSPFADAGGNFNTGRVRVFSGASGALLLNTSGTANEDLLGWSVAGTACANVIAGSPIARAGGEALVLDSGQTGIPCRIFSFRASGSGPLISLPARSLR